MSNSDPCVINNLFTQIKDAVSVANEAGVFNPKLGHFGEFTFRESIPRFPAVTWHCPEEGPDHNNKAPESFYGWLVCNVFGQQMNPEYVGTGIRRLAHDLRQLLNLELDHQAAVGVDLQTMKYGFYDRSADGMWKVENNYPVCELRYRLLYKERFTQ